MGLVSLGYDHRLDSRLPGCDIGDRSSKSCQGLWDSLPEAYRQGALYFTDFWEAYSAVLPPESHQAGGKETALTIPLDNVFPDLSTRRFSFPKSSTTILELFGCSFINSERLRHLDL
jgi:hypothetical protein